ncbi:hypothetical protein [Pyxidicoccus trucidator]|uniref:hypothetical protein n=1 Tax=Pyxidicoccus trucidator TaxID=2709662 RepID=UPI0013DD39EC|nr:hypothetical protein [Pyxidicoccus trucidator]
MSRLRGFLDVRGINPSPEDGEQQHLIRRAVVLHGLLGEIIPNIVLGDARSIGEGVLHALLTVGQYKHGTRSLESILRMSNTRGEHSFTQSCLPSAPQLDLHVDSVELLRAFGP